MHFLLWQQCLQASARCKDSPSVLWHFEMQNRINEPQSLRSLAHSANVATILFHDRLVSCLVSGCVTLSLKIVEEGVYLFILL